MYLIFSTFYNMNKNYKVDIAELKVNHYFCKKQAKTKH